MKKNTTDLQPELQKSAENQNNSNSNYEIIKTVENTPFALVRNEKKVRIVFGDTIASDKTFNSEKEAIDYINEKPYELLIVASGIFTYKLLNLKEN